MPRWMWTSERVAGALEIARSDGPSRLYTGVSTDTRTLGPGELFVALKGERYDGTEYLGDAARAGARGAVVERRPGDVPAELELFRVDDTLRALGRLAKARRRALAPVVVAITGTSGKTTTRELAAAALGVAAYESPGNFNNLVGLPLSILRASDAAPIWLLEIASNQPGEVERLGRVAEPNHAVITSVSEGHLEGLGDLEGVLREKLSLLDTLRPGGQALVADEPGALAKRARESGAEVRTVGLGAGADLRPDSWSITPDGVAWRWQESEFSLAGFGSHLVRNAMFALGIAELVGVDPEDAARRLRGFKLPPMRGELRRLGDLLLLIDCYNANPASFTAAIESLSALAGGRRRAVLAGTMLELGDRSLALHEGVAEELLAAGIELVAVTGAFAEAFARIAGRPRDGLIVADELEAAYRELATHLRGEEAVLIKASRGMKFERAIPLFERDFGGRSLGNPGRVKVSGT